MYQHTAASVAGTGIIPNGGTAPVISVVVPAYNEAAGLARTVDQIVGELATLAVVWEVILVDDGSSDDTFAQICRLSMREPRIKGLRLSRNFGKEGALLAGLDRASGHAVLTMDADRQHPPSLIPEMFSRWRAGAKVVHGVKRNRRSDPLRQRLGAQLVSRLLAKWAALDVHNSADFKLLDRQVVEVIRNLPERARFYRGLTSWIGFPDDYVEFDVPARRDDGSKWSMWGLIELAITALSSFSSLPLRIVTLLGLATLILGVFVAGEALWSWMKGSAVSGFATIIITLLIIGSFIMISLGIIGEYVAKIYQEVKARPHYLVLETVGLAPIGRSDGKRPRDS
jgi:glycosyltransferase involved in cell wall biosynthesis